jgi:hypothetical protein
MGFSSIDDLVNEISTNAKFVRQPYSREVRTSATSAAGRWHHALDVAGTGGVMTVTGTPGTGVVMNRSTAGAIPLNANVSSDTRHLLAMSAFTASTTMVPAVVLLTDIIHMYPSLVVVTTPSTMSNHPTWTGTGDTRMTNANGVQAAMFLSTASSAAGQITMTYNDQGGASSTTTAPAGSVFSPIAAHPGGAFFGQTLTSATVGGLNMPLAAGDTGVQSVQSYVINANATGGTGCILLHRPIATIPIVAANVAGERDFLNQIPALPRIYDDACLALFVLIGGAMTTTGHVIQGDIVYGWG